MASFVVMEPPARVEADAVIVRDGFHVFAFLIPFVWLLVHRLWIEALIALVVALALGFAGSYAGFAAAPALSLLVSLYVGLEGASLKLAALRRRGWREWGVVEADNRTDAETRYIAEAYVDGTADDRPAPLPVLSSASQLRQTVPAAGPALGLFSYPGRH
ncbi:DUF2628 domain-containing protein [Mesorhizobium sp. CAU 1732]|uniref:DUF2628 domain-containing protein n=1 Tax=Mesorhizobium sp. CAU 1732 TaxID=3140358 RepID=UPI003260A0CB